MKKFFSILLSACFLLNIAWTSGYASVTEDLLKKRNIKQIASPHATAAVSPGQMPLSPRESAQGVTAVKTEIGYDLKDARGNTVGFYDEATGKVTKKDPEGKTVVHDRSELDEHFNLKKRLHTPGIEQRDMKGTQRRWRAGVGSGREEDTKQTAAKVTDYVGGWLQEYADANAGKKAAMAATLGLSVSQLADLSAESAQKISAYLRGQGEKVINCAVESLEKVLSLNGKLFTTREAAQQAILIDVLTGSLKAPEAGKGEGQMQLSMFAIQQTAKLHKVGLNGYKTNEEGLKEAVAGNGNAVAQLKLANGEEHFVVVTDIRNGMVTCYNNGVKETGTLEEFKAQWTGNILTNRRGVGDALSGEQLRQLKGSASDQAVHDAAQVSKDAYWKAYYAQAQAEANKSATNTATTNATTAAQSTTGKTTASATQSATPAATASAAASAPATIPSAPGQPGQSAQADQATTGQQTQTPPATAPEAPAVMTPEQLQDDIAKNIGKKVTEDTKKYDLNNDGVIGIDDCLNVVNNPAIAEKVIKGEKIEKTELVTPPPVVFAASAHMGEAATDANKMYDVDNNKVVELSDVIAISKNPALVVQNASKEVTDVAANIGKEVNDDTKKYDIDGNKVIDARDVVLSGDNKDAFSRDALPQVLAAVNEMGKQVAAGNKKYDVDGNGAIDINDVLMINGDASLVKAGDARFEVMEVMEQDGKAATGGNKIYDVNNDDSINILDALAVAGKPSLLKGDVNDRTMSAVESWLTRYANAADDAERAKLAEELGLKDLTPDQLKSITKVNLGALVKEIKSRSGDLLGIIGRYTGTGDKKSETVAMAKNTILVDVFLDTKTGDGKITLSLNGMGAASKKLGIDISSALVASMVEDWLGLYLQSSAADQAKMVGALGVPANGAVPITDANARKIADYVKAKATDIAKLVKDAFGFESDDKVLVAEIAKNTILGDIVTGKLDTGKAKLEFGQASVDVTKKQFVFDLKTAPDTVKGVKEWLDRFVNAKDDAERSQMAAALGITLSDEQLKRLTRGYVQGLMGDVEEQIGKLVYTVSRYTGVEIKEDRMSEIAATTILTDILIGSGQDGKLGVSIVAMGKAAQHHGINIVPAMVAACVEDYLKTYLLQQDKDKQGIAMGLGIPVESLVKISAETAQKIVDFVKKKGSDIVQLVKDLFKFESDDQVMVANIIQHTILVDAVTGKFDTTKEKIELSQNAVSATLKQYGVDIVSLPKTVAGIEAWLTGFVNAEDDAAREKMLADAGIEGVKAEQFKDITKEAVDALVKELKGTGAGLLYLLGRYTGVEAGSEQMVGVAQTAILMDYFAGIKGDDGKLQISLQSIVKSAERNNLDITPSLSIAFVQDWLFGYVGASGDDRKKMVEGLGLSGDKARDLKQEDVARIIAYLTSKNGDVAVFIKDVLNAKSPDKVKTASIAQYALLFDILNGTLDTSKASFAPSAEAVDSTREKYVFEIVVAPRVVEALESWLKTYEEADAVTRAKMAKEIGINQYDLQKLIKEPPADAMNDVKLYGDELSRIISRYSGVDPKDEKMVKIAVDVLLQDIVAGTKTSDNKLNVSIGAIAKAAKHLEIDVTAPMTVAFVEDWGRSYLSASDEEKAKMTGEIGLTGKDTVVGLTAESLQKVIAYLKTKGADIDKLVSGAFNYNSSDEGVVASIGSNALLIDILTGAITGEGEGELKLSETAVSRTKSKFHSILYPQYDTTYSGGNDAGAGSSQWDARRAQEEYARKQQQIRRSAVPQAINRIVRWLMEYFNASPEQRARMAAQFGLAGGDLKGLSKKKLAAIIAYLKENGESIGAIFDKAFENGSEATRSDSVNAVSDAVLADLLTGKIDITQEGFTLSQNAIDAVREKFGIDLSGSSRVVKSIDSWLNEYVNAGAAKKAQMAATLGLSVEQLADISAQTAQSIIAYLKGQGAGIFNCAISSLNEVLKAGGIAVDKGEVAKNAILVDILTGNITRQMSSSSSGEQMQSSMLAIQKAAARYGFELTGYTTDINGLSDALKNGPAIAHLDLGNGRGHFVTVLGVGGGMVTYADADGTTHKVSAADWEKQWKGNLLSGTNAVNGKRLDTGMLHGLMGAGDVWNRYGEKIGTTSGKSYTDNSKAATDTHGGGAQASKPWNGGGSNNNSGGSKNNGGSNNNSGGSKNNGGSNNNGGSSKNNGGSNNNNGGGSSGLKSDYSNAIWNDYGEVIGYNSSGSGFTVHGSAGTAIHGGGSQSNTNWSVSGNTGGGSHGGTPNYTISDGKTTISVEGSNATVVMNYGSGKTVNMPLSDFKAINDFGAQYMAAYNDPTMANRNSIMDNAHQQAEAIRASYGYIGGNDGSGFKAIATSPSSDYNKFISDKLRTGELNAVDYSDALDNVAYFGSKERYAVAIMGKDYSGFGLDQANAAQAFRIANTDLFKGGLQQVAQTLATEVRYNGLSNKYQVAHEAFGAAMQTIGDPMGWMNKSITELSVKIGSAIDGTLTKSGLRNEIIDSANKTYGANNPFKFQEQFATIGDKVKNGQALSLQERYFQLHLEEFGFKSAAERANDYINTMGKEGYLRAGAKGMLEEARTGNYALSDPSAYRNTVEHLSPNDRIINAYDQVSVKSNPANGNEKFIILGWQDVAKVNAEGIAYHNTSGNWEMKFSKSFDQDGTGKENKDYQGLLTTFAGKGYDAVKAILVGNGTYAKESYKGVMGDFTATNAGYVRDSDGTGKMAILYNSVNGFNDGYRLTGIKGSEPVLSVESVKNGERTQAIVYSLKEGLGKNADYEFYDGAKASLPFSLGDVQKASYWGKDANGNAYITNIECKDGLVSAGETVGLVTNNGIVAAGGKTVFDRSVFEGAYRDLGEKGTEAGKAQGSFVETNAAILKYQDAVKAMHGMMLKGSENLAAERFSSKYIEGSKVVSFKYDPSTSMGAISRVTETGVTITAANVAYGQDWRNDWTIPTGKNSRGAAQLSFMDGNRETLFETANVTFNDARDISQCTYSFGDRTKNHVQQVEKTGTGLTVTTHVNVAINESARTFDTAGATSLEERFNRTGDIISAKIHADKGGWVPLSMTPSRENMIGMLQGARTENISQDLDLSFAFEDNKPVLVEVNGKAPVTREVVVETDKGPVTHTELVLDLTGIKVTTADAAGVRHAAGVDYARYQLYDGTYALWGVTAKGSEYYQSYGAPGAAGAAKGPESASVFAPSAKVTADWNGMLFEVGEGHNGIQIIHGNLAWQKDGAVYDFAPGSTIARNNGAVLYYGGEGSRLQYAKDDNGNLQESFINTRGTVVTAGLASDAILQTEHHLARLGEGITNIDFKTDGIGRMLITDDVACTQGNTVGTLLAGSQIFLNQNNELGVKAGEFKTGETMFVADNERDSRLAKDGAANAGKEGEGQRGLVDVRSRGVFKAVDGGYVAQEGSVISIRDGALVVEGRGTQFLTGSVLRDGQVVRRGVLEVMGSYEMNIKGETRRQLIYAAADDGTARTSLGSMTVNYDGQGVSSAYVSQSGRSILSGSAYNGYSISGSMTTYFKKTQQNGYNVLAYDSNGNMIVSHTASNIRAVKTVTEMVTVGKRATSVADFKRMEYGNWNEAEPEEIRVTATHVISIDASGRASSAFSCGATKVDGTRLTTSMAMLDGQKTLLFASDQGLNRQYAFNLDFGGGSITAFDGTGYATNKAGDFRSVYTANSGVLSGIGFEIKETVGKESYWASGSLNYDSSVFIPDNQANMQKHGQAFAPRAISFNEAGDAAVGAQLINKEFGWKKDANTGTVIQIRWDPSNDDGAGAARGYVLDSFLVRDGVAGARNVMMRSDTGTLKIGDKVMEFGIENGALGFVDDMSRFVSFDKGSALAGRYNFKAEDLNYTITGMSLDRLSADVTVNANLNLKERQSVFFNESMIDSEVMSAQNGQGGAKGQQSGSATRTGGLALERTGDGINFTCTDGNVALGVRFGLDDAMAGTLKGKSTFTNFTAGTEVHIINNLVLGVRGSADLGNNVIAEIQDGSNLNIQAGTKVMIQSDGGLVHNLGGIREGRIDYKEIVGVSNGGQKDIVSRTLSATKGAIDVSDIKINGVAGEKLSVNNDRQNIDFSQGAIVSGLDINDTLHTAGEKAQHTAVASWDAIGGGWGLAKIAAGVVGTVVGAVVVGLAGWTGIGAVAGGALIAGSLTLLGVGGITYAQTGDLKQAAKEGAISAAFAAIPGIGMAGGLTGRLAGISGNIATKAMGRGITGAIAKTSVSAGKAIMSSPAGTALRGANFVFNPFARGWTNKMAGTVVGKLAGTAATEGLVGTAARGGVVGFLRQPLTRAATREAFANTLSVGARMGVNAAVYEGVIPSAIKASGHEIDPRYQAAADLVVLAPLMTSGMGPVAKGSKGLLRSLWNDKGALAQSLSTSKGRSQALRTFLNYDSIAGKSFAELKATAKLGLKNMGREMVEGLSPVNLLNRTAQITSDVLLFTTGSSAVLGGVNTLTGGALGYDGKQVLGIFTISKFDDPSDALTTLSQQAVGTAVSTLPFAVLMGAAQPLLGGFVRNFPGLGPLMQYLGKSNAFFGGRLAQGRIGRWQGFVYEEAFKEQIPQMLMGDRLFGTNSMGSEVFQELFDRNGGRIGPANYRTVSNNLGSGYAGAINGIRRIDRNSIGSAEETMNAALAKAGSSLGVKLDILPQGAGADIKARIIDRTIPAVTVSLNEGIAVTGATGLKNLMMSVGAAAGTPGSDIARQIAQNNAVLQTYDSDLKSLTASQTIDFLAGMPAAGMKDGAIDLSYNIAENRGINESMRFVQGIVPAMGVVKDTGRKQQMAAAVRREVAAAADIAAAHPTPDAVSNLSRTAALMLDGSLDRATKLDVARTVVKSIALGMETAASQPADKVQQVMESLEMLSNGVLNLRDKPLAQMLAAAVAAEPAVVQAARAWQLREAVEAQTDEREPRGSLAAVLDFAHKQTGADARIILENIRGENADAREKILLANYASGLLLGAALEHQPVDETVGELLNEVAAMPQDGLAGAEKTFLIDTVVKLDKLAGRLRTQETARKDAAQGDAVGALIADNWTAYATAKVKADSLYGKTNAVDAGLKATVNAAAAICDTLGSGGEMTEAEMEKLLKNIPEGNREMVRQAVAKYDNYKALVRSGRPWSGSYYETAKYKDRRENAVTEEEAGAEAAAMVAAEIVMNDVAGKVRKYNGKFKDFSAPQKEAFKEIVTQLLERNSSLETGSGKTARAAAEIAQKRYTHVLQTGGGKTFLVAMSALLMRMQTTANGQFIGAFTNTIDNAKDIAEHLNGIFGNGSEGSEGLGSVVVLGADEVERVRQNPRELDSFREKLANASVVVTTYDIWSGLVASDFAQILADEQHPQQSAKVRALLEKNDIKVARDRAGRMNIEDATKAREAVKLLAQEAKKDDAVKAALADTMIPLDKVGDAVADEIDFFSTIPMQALAKAMGKYYTAESVARYYRELAGVKEGDAPAVERVVGKYRDMGIDELRIRRELRKKGDFARLAKLYERVNAMVLEQNAPADITKAGFVASEMDALGLSREQFTADLKEFAVNHKARQYFEKLAEVTSRLHKTANERKGSIAIRGTSVKTGFAHGSDESFISEIMNMEGGDSAADVTRLERQTSEETGAATDFKKSIKAEADRLRSEFGNLFSEREVIEHLWNGIGAHRMTEGREFVVRDNRIIVTNLGREVENLSLPAGMMQVLEAKYNADISKPNVESYVSNSVFAMSMFNNIVGLTGTVSRANEVSVLKRMGFVKNGNAPRAAGHNRLFQTQEGMIRFMYEAAGAMNDKGAANFNLVLTPDSAISGSAYRGIRGMLAADLERAGVASAEAQQIVDLLCGGETAKVDSVRKQLMLRYPGKAAEITKIMSSTVKYISPGVTNEELDALRKDVQEGKYKYVIGDAYLLGRGWNVGAMTGIEDQKGNVSRGANDALKEMQGATAAKVQANCWLLEPELMTESQMLQAAGRIDPFSDNRFATKAYSKDVISLFSVENARQVQTLRDALGDNDGWNIDVVLSNLEKVQLENEEEALRKAGQKVVVSRQKQWLESKNGTQVKHAENDAAREELKKQGWDDAQIDSQVPAGEGQLSDASWFKYENLSRFHALLKSVVRSDVKAREILKSITQDDSGSSELETAASGDAGAMIRLALDKAGMADAKGRDFSDAGACRALKGVMDAADEFKAEDARSKGILNSLKEKDATYLEKVEEKLAGADTGVGTKLWLAFIRSLKYPKLSYAGLSVSGLKNKAERRLEAFFKEVASRSDAAGHDAALALIAGIKIKGDGLAFSEKTVEQAGSILKALPQDSKAEVLGNVSLRELRSGDAVQTVVSARANSQDPAAKALRNAVLMERASNRAGNPWFGAVERALNAKGISAASLLAFIKDNGLPAIAEASGAKGAFDKPVAYLELLNALPEGGNGEAGIASFVKLLDGAAAKAVAAEGAANKAAFGTIAGAMASASAGDALLLARAVNEHVRSAQPTDTVSFIAGFAKGSANIAPAAAGEGAIVQAIQNWADAFNNRESLAEKAGMLAFLGLTPLNVPARMLEAALDIVTPGTQDAAVTEAPAEAAGFVNCAVRAVQQVTGIEESATYANAAIGYLIDIAQGDGDTVFTGQPQMSMFAIKALAERAGVPMQAVNVEGIENLQRLNVSKADGQGKAVIHLARGDIGHFVVITDMNKENGTVTYVDNQKENIVPVETFKELFGAQFTGKALVDTRSFMHYVAALEAGRDKDEPEGADLQDLKAAGGATAIRAMGNEELPKVKGGAAGIIAGMSETAETMAGYAGQKRVLLKNVFGVTRPDNWKMNVAVRGVLYGCRTEADLMNVLGVDAAAAASASPEERSRAVNDGYFSQADAVLKLEVSPDKAELRIAMMQVARAILLSEEARAQFNALASKTEISPAEVSSLRKAIETDYAKVNKAAAVWVAKAQKSAGQALPALEGADLMQINVEALRKAVEAKRSWIGGIMQPLRSLIHDRAAEDEMKDILGNDGFRAGGTLIRNQSIKFNPLGSLAIVQSA